MSATAQLSQQLAQLSDSLKATNTLISQLSKLSFQPGSEPLDGEGSVRVELTQDIHDSLKQLEEDLELLKQEAEDWNPGSGYRRRESERDREKARVSAQSSRLEEDLRQSRSRFRRAQLSAKKASEGAKQRERELVFASLQNSPPADQLPNGTEAPPTPDLFAGRRRLAQQKQLTKEELQVDASSNVTAALRRTHDLLSTELSRSRFAQETFDQSTAALAELGEHYSNLDTILSNSRNLLGTLLRSQKSDTWYLETAFYILLATLCWLVFRRILLGPFVRLPLFVWTLVSFLVRWIVLKPLYFLALATGVVTTSPANSPARSVSESRPPLIVQPSASGGAPKFTNMADLPKGGIPAGAGGQGAKVGRDPAVEGKLSEEIAQMAEQSARQDREPASQQQDEGRKRGDGTVLEERGEVPRNPRKKMFEADVEDRKHEEQQQRKRDEL